MTSMIRRALAPSETGVALRALCDWTPPDAPVGGLHPGDVGWYLRFEEAIVHLWTDGDPIAVGFFDGPVFRVTVAPGADSAAIAAEAEKLIPADSDAWVDGLPMPGWDEDPESRWPFMSWTPRPVTSRARLVGEDDVADRVLVQRSAFERSTFTEERWHRIMASPAAGLAVEALVRTPSGAPAAAATGWFAGVGRCGLLEPVGTHPDHRGHGYGRDAVLAVCAALVDRGASAVAVTTPPTNEAAIALYRSAGFTVVRETRAWVRARRA